MKTVNRVIASMAVVLLLAGCAATPSGAPKEKSTSATTATPSAAPKLPAVSLETSCNFLFGIGSRLDGPVPKTSDVITRFVANPDASTITADEIATIITGLKTATDNAQTDLQPFIEAQMAPLEKLHTALTGGANTSIDFGDYKQSGIELINRCRPFITG